jgi:hypothetical protein
MKIVISEKQLKNLKSEFTEEVNDPAAAAPSAGTSSSGAKQGYPEVGKWESGVTRGPGNQIGVTKWSDVVGSLLKRDKANPLK